MPKLHGRRWTSCGGEKRRDQLPETRTDGNNGLQMGRRERSSVRRPQVGADALPLQTNHEHLPEAKVKLPNGTVIEPGETHIKTKTAAAMRAFMTIARLANTEKGLSQKHLHQLYITCITTISDFGAEVWWKNQKVQCKTLQKIQNQAL